MNEQNQEQQQQKWQSTAGPIQTKKVQEALKAIMQEGRTFEELYGVTGVDEHRSCMYSPFSPPRPETNDAWKQVGDKFAWNITRENYQQVIAFAAEAVEGLKKSRPVTDKRRSAEEAEKQRQEREAAEQKRQADALAKEQQVQSLIPKLRELYPWAVSERDMPRARESVRCAANIKQELTRSFPGVTFSVTTEGYDSIRVRWSLGPTVAEVEALTGKYKNATWASDGGDGYWEHDHSADGGALDVVLGRVRYIGVSREFPSEVQTKVGMMICEAAKVTWGGMETRGVRGPESGDNLGDFVHRLLHHTHIPAGARLLGVRDLDAEQQAFWNEMLSIYGEGWANSIENLTEEHQAKYKEWDAINNRRSESHYMDGFELQIEKPDHIAQAVPDANETPATGNVHGAYVRYNVEHDGVEVSFPSKPERAMIDNLKGSQFRWSHRSKVWYHRFSEYHWRVAHEIIGVPVAAFPKHKASTPDRFDMQVEDNMAAACGL